MFYGVESDKTHVERIIGSSRVRYIDGDGFLARLLPSPMTRDFFTTPDAPLSNIPGATHSGLVHNPYDIAEVGRIINETAKVKSINFVSMYTLDNDNFNLKPANDNEPFIMRKAA